MSAQLVYTPIPYSLVCDTDREAYYKFLEEESAARLKHYSICMNYIRHGVASSGFQGVGSGVPVRGGESRGNGSRLLEVGSVDVCDAGSSVDTAGGVRDCGVGEQGGCGEIVGDGSSGGRCVKFSVGDTGGTSSGDSRGDVCLSEVSGISDSEVDRVADKERKKKDRKEKNFRRKANRRLAKGSVSCELGGSPVKSVAGSGNCGSGGCPEPSWRRGALSETVPVSGLREQGFFSEIAREKRIRLRESRAEMLVKQNELAMLRAERELKVLEAADIEVEKRKYVTSLRAATERNMVSIEKTHAQLVATDNVPRSDLDHDVHTVLTGDVPGLSSGSISPNSSASMAEFRACQKEILDLKAAFAKLGYSETTIPYIGKKDWTINSQGTIDDAAHAALDELMPGGYALDGQQFAEKGDKVGVMSLGQWGY